MQDRLDGLERLVIAHRLRKRCGVIRAGDFFGGGPGSWFDLAIAKRAAAGALVYPGPLDRPHAWAYLPDLAQEHPNVAPIPILSDARGVQLIVKKWERKKRLPDAIVIEHPRLAGGHLGAAKIADLNDPRFDFENVIPQALEFLRAAGLEASVPLIHQMPNHGPAR